MKSSSTGGARSRARKLAMQALYQRDIGGHTRTEVTKQFAADGLLKTADGKYFKTLLRGVEVEAERIEAALSAAADRPLVQLDPVEHAILRLATWELICNPEVPFRSVIDEAVSLTKRFGAQDGHRFVNAVLDAIARKVRGAETGQAER